VWVDDSPDDLFGPYLRDAGDGLARDAAWLRQMLAGWPREPPHGDGPPG
jgi:hypothetical protein